MIWPVLDSGIDQEWSFGWPGLQVCGNDNIIPIPDLDRSLCRAQISIWEIWRSWALNRSGIQFRLTGSGSKRSETISGQQWSRFEFLIQIAPCQSWTAWFWCFWLWVLRIDLENLYGWLCAGFGPVEDGLQHPMPALFPILSKSAAGSSKIEQKAPQAAPKWTKSAAGGPKLD